VAFELRREQYVVSTDDSLLDIDFVHRYLSEDSYWAKGVPRDVFEKAITNSLNFGLYDGARQIGFARAITDRAWFAYIADVFVDETYRGRGLGKMIMEAVTSHPDLNGIRRLMLGTADAHGLYEQFEFVPLIEPRRWMERGDPDIYRKMAS
jgi:GNAT superfamily N-acetyltransferase